MIAVDKIRPNPFQPRQIFDEKALNELAQSIKKSGIYQPLILRQPVSEIERFEIIAGERRFRASQIAGLKEVPAIVRYFSDSSAVEAAIIENLQREDLTPIEEAEAYQSMMDSLNLTQAQVAKRLGKSRPYIANALRLLSLPTKVKDMLQANQLSMGQARTLLGLKAKKNIEKLAKKTVSKHLTVRQLEEIVNDSQGKIKFAQKKSADKDPYIEVLEQKMDEKFGTRSNIITKAKDAGKIEINYDSLQDLNRILDILNISID